MEYELIMCLIPTVVPFKLRICSRAIDLAQRIKCPRLKIPFCLGFIRVFYSVVVSWPAQCRSGTVSPKWEIFPIPPTSPSFPLLGAQALWLRAWKGSALDPVPGIHIAFASPVAAADGGDVPCGVFLSSLCLGGGDGKELAVSTSQRKVRFCPALRPVLCI